MGECLVWGRISDPNINQDTIGKLFHQLSHGRLDGFAITMGDGGGDEG